VLLNRKKSAGFYKEPSAKRTKISNNLNLANRHFAAFGRFCGYNNLSE